VFELSTFAHIFLHDCRRKPCSHYRHSTSTAVCTARPQDTTATSLDKRLLLFKSACSTASWAWPHRGDVCECTELPPRTSVSVVTVTFSMLYDLMYHEHGCCCAHLPRPDLRSMPHGRAACTCDCMKPSCIDSMRSEYVCILVSCFRHKQIHTISWQTRQPQQYCFTPGMATGSCMKLHAVGGCHCDVW
jgi:hypothetical protein